MKSENIITVIDELGNIINEFKSEIKFKDEQIEKLNKKITYIEQILDFYSKKWFFLDYSCQIVKK